MDPPHPPPGPSDLPADGMKPTDDKQKIFDPSDAVRVMESKARAG